MIKRSLIALVSLASAACGAGGAGGNCSSFCPDGAKNIELAVDVVVSDFNGDGQPDVALPVSEGFGTPGYAALFLHMPTSGKGYLQRKDYPADSYPDTITATDLNGDGRPDIIMTSEHSNTVVLLINEAANPGTFSIAQTFNITAAQRVAAVDLNGDGRPDLVISGAPEGAIQVALQNPGTPGTFAPPVSLYSGSDAVAVGDLNGDGMPDLVAANLTQVQVLFLQPNAKSPVIASALSIYTPVNGVNAAAVADVDGDGHNDVLIVDTNAKAIVVLLQDPNAPGTFLPPRSFPLPSGSGGINLVVADLNGDGHPDLVTGGDSSVAVFMQDAAHPGEFLAATSYPVGSIAVAVADIDGDGHPDIVTISGVSNSVVNGVYRMPPGVLYQNATRPGTFLGLQDLK